MCVQTEGSSRSESESGPKPDESWRPRNWSRRRKWTATLILSAVCFVQTLVETGLAPSEAQVTRDLALQAPWQWMLANSVILAGTGLSSLVLAPLSEVYGRRPVLLAGAACFVVWNTGCGAVGTLRQLLVLRALSGLGASVGDAVSGGFLADLWNAVDRGSAYAVSMAAPLIGTAVGPIGGAVVADAAGWRWVFWSTSLASALTLVLVFFFLRETFKPRCAPRSVLHPRRRRRQEQKEEIKVEGQAAATPSFVAVMRENLQRPFRMLATQVIVQLLAVYMAALYGIMWLFLFMYPRLWRGGDGPSSSSSSSPGYGQDARAASLNYVSFALGLLAGVFGAGRAADWTYARLQARNGGVGRPEFRVPTMAVGTVLAPAGLLCWGWAGQRGVHWMVPNAGSFVFAAGMYVCSACVSVYTIDAYDARYAASAISTNLVLRSVTAAFFPLFAPYMFDALGFGYGATALAVGFAVFGLAIMAVLWFFGEALRRRSPYCAAASDDDDN